MSAALLLLTLAAAILPLGGAMRWGQAIVATAAAIALVPSLWSRSAAQRISPLLILLGVAIAITTVQIIPLPSDLIAWINPTGEGFRRDGAVLAGTDPASRISLDPPATLRSLVHFVTLLGVALVALRLSTQERGRYYVIAGVVVVIGFTAFLTALHELFGATSLYGLYEPRARPAILGPLLNENHLGGLMGIGAVAGVGLLLYQRQPTWVRVVWLVLVAGCCAIAMMTQSRGAAISLVAGMVVTIGVIAGQRFGGGRIPQRHRARLLTNALPIGVVATSAMVIAVYVSAGELQRQFDKTSLRDIASPQSKFAAWRSAGSLIEESPWVGVGRGAMESSFTRVHPASGHVTFSHVENEYIQTVVDYGIVGAIALVIALGLVMFAAVRRWNGGALAAAALGGLACIGVQSVVDFGIELPGIAVPVVALFATLTYVQVKEAPRSVRLKVRGLRAGAIALLLGSVGLIAADCTRTLDEDREWIEESGRAITMTDLAEVIERHPLSYYPFAIRAQQLARSRDPNAIRFLNHAMLLHPTHPGLHHLAARILRRSGYENQAVIEYAAALRATNDKQRLLAEILSAFPDEKAVMALPDDPHELEVTVKMLRELEHTSVATLWLVRLLKTRRTARACEQLFEISLQDGDLDAAEIAGKSCPDMMPDRHTRMSLARMLYKNQRYSDILPLLADVEDWRGRIDDTVSAWLLLCDARVGLGQLDEAKRCLRRLDVSGDVRAERKAELKVRFERIEKLRAEPNSVPAKP